MIISPAQSYRTVRMVTTIPTTRLTQTRDYSITILATVATIMMMVTYTQIHPIGMIWRISSCCMDTIQPYPVAI
jgi:hypothetical protein